MKHADISLKTKRTLAGSLKKLVEQKSLSRITISELCRDCGLNRKTFYYHFDDIQSLLKWMLEQEAENVIKKQDLLTDYQALLALVIDYVDDNNDILNRMYDTTKQNSITNFFFPELRKAVKDMIEDLEKKTGCAVDEEFREFLGSFYTTSLSSLLIDRLQETCAYTKEELMDYIIFTLRSSLPAILKARSAVLDPHPGLK
ncbi:MAG: TetR family transcriptional regulator [Lachnospiraceae bacterium]|nr:TetR family transcriptional regulator [Lachnospiraceae bacterium]